jgi:signal transduction histidine kinase
MILLRRRVAVLEERQKITRDLHDTVKQQAFATAMLIGSAREHFRRGANDELGRNLMEVEELARRMQEDLRTILQEMRAATLLPLPRQLMQMAEEWSRQTGLPIHRRIAPEAENLSPVLSEQVARIVGEALSNVAKHSHATQVELAFERIGDLWSLLIADNGQGIAEKSTRGMGIGLQTMRERARELPEGHLEIVNAPLGGTRVTLTFREVDL